MAGKIWNWTLDNWPQFTYDTETLRSLEYKFSQRFGTVLGTLMHLADDVKEVLLVEILSNEAIKTSAIEGDILNRDSVQSSIKRNLGFSVDHRKASAAEFGISEMMVDLYLNYNQSLSDQLLFEWHKMLTNGRRDLTDIGRYRTHQEPMQVVSGRLYSPRVHFEAPPSSIIIQEMKLFVDWFNNAHYNTEEGLDLLPLTKAGIAHLYFVSIHPFEDGNGRIGRSIAEKSLAISANRPTLISLSHEIESNKKEYYRFLEKHNKTLEITDWLVYFGQTILNAQDTTIKQISFLIEKVKFFDQYSTSMNPRQLKVVIRLFDAGHKGFEGGLSADNYRKIAKTSASTTTRDLNDLVAKQILSKSGLLKSTRYSLNIIDPKFAIY
jgi:Fic family protein